MAERIVLGSMISSRDAAERVLEVLNREDCFSDGTHRAVYAAVPADRLLVETDAPAMRLPADRERFPPLPVADGTLANHPANLATTYAALAEWRGREIGALAMQVEENFLRLFSG